MAFIKRRNDDHLLVVYRPVAGGSERTWRCPDEESFKKFDELEKAMKAAGMDVPDPVAQFGEVACGGAMAGSAAVPTQSLEASVPNGESVYSLSEWLGTPAAPGPFFADRSVLDERVQAYERSGRLHAPHIHWERMTDVTDDDALLVRDKMLICPNCLLRAESAGRKDLVEKAAERLLATKRPWDGKGKCTDEYGEFAHYPRYQRETIKSVLGTLRSAWGSAIAFGKGDSPRDLRCVGIRSNPFADISIPNFQDRPDDDDLAQALSHTQLDRLERAMQPWLSASVPTGAYGLVRRSELLGMMRVNIGWPTSPEDEGQSTIQITHVWIDGELRPWGKTPGSTWEPIYLAALATEKLRAHMLSYRSNPNPKLCVACREGKLEHVGPPPLNPHRRCDFANNAPVWANPKTNERPSEDYFTRKLFPKACRSAGLVRETLGFHVSPKTLRATGATLLLEAGIEVELVRRMGRWADAETLLRHYNRVRDQAKARAARILDLHARGELGLPGAEDAPIDAQAKFLARRVDALLGEVAMLRVALSDLGVDPEGIVGVAPAEEKVGLFDDDLVLSELIRSGRSRKAILEALGASLASKNYRRLERRAAELNLELPQKWLAKPAETVHEADQSADDRRAA